MLSDTTDDPEEAWLALAEAELTGLAEEAEKAEQLPTSLLYRSLAPGGVDLITPDPRCGGIDNAVRNRCKGDHTTCASRRLNDAYTLKRFHNLVAWRLIEPSRVLVIISYGDYAGDDGFRSVFRTVANA